MDRLDECGEGQLRLVRQIFEFVAAREFVAIGDLVDDDVVMDMPFQLPGLARQAVGKTAFLDFMKTSSIFDPFILEVTNCRQFVGSAGLMVRYSGHAAAKTTGRPYDNTYLGLFEFRGPALCSWTEFHNPLVFCRALDIDPCGPRVLSSK